MQNSEISALLNDYADLLEIEGANSFRTRAYRNAGRTLESLSESITQWVEEKRSLEELQGVGKDMAKRITEIVETGTFTQLVESQEKIPRDVRAMLRIPGIGPKKVSVLFKDLNLTSLDELKQAAIEHRIADQKGFGKKTEQVILDGLEHLESAGQRVYLADALPLVQEIENDLRKLKEVSKISTAGSTRRAKETVGDLDLLVTSDDSETVMKTLAEHPLVDSVLAQGETKQRVRLMPFKQAMTPGGRGFQLELDLRVVPEESFGAAMQYFTGSKEHNIVLRRKAKEHGWTLNEYGLAELDNKENIIASKTEEEIYNALELAWVPPELREDRGEIEHAEQNEFADLIELKQIKGDLHMHTTATDGKASILEMAEAAKERGLKYIAITDHSKRVTMAGGLDGPKLLKHWENIRNEAEKISGIEILCGIECDILEDATMDLSDEVLKEADWVLGVLHYGLKQPRKKITERLLCAITNPHVSAIGHMSGRLVGKRPPADLDLETVLKAASDHGVMMEINAHPARLDLTEIHAAKAKEMGIPIVINTDAHSTTGLDVMKWGIQQARRAGLTKDDVANTKTLKQFKKMLRKS